MPDLLGYYAERIAYEITIRPQAYLQSRNALINLRIALVNAELRCQRDEEDQRKLLETRREA